MMEIMGCALCGECAGISISSPVAEVKRTDNESPYTSAVVRHFRRDVTARRLAKLFQIMCVSLVVDVSTAVILF